MKRVWLFLLSIIIVFTLIGCAQKSSESTSSNGANYSRPAAGGQTATAPSIAPEAQPSKGMIDTNDAVKTTESSTQDMNLQPQDGRKIIYNASVMLDIKDLKGSYDSIISKAQEMGGYIASSNIRENDSQITMRVPAVKLSDFLKFLDTLGGENKESSVNTSDVTDQYTDMDSRVRNLKAQEEQLLSIMKKAVTVDETLKVQSELYRVRGEIESLEGKLKMWDKLIEYSTVSINLKRIQEIGDKDVKVSFITWSELVNGISNGFKATLNFVVRFFSGIFILLISALPVIPFIAVAVWFILRYIKKSKKNISG